MPFPVREQARILRRHLRSAEKQLQWEVRTGKTHPIVAREELAAMNDAAATLEALDHAIAHDLDPRQAIEALSQVPDATAPPATSRRCGMAVGQPGPR